MAQVVLYPPSRALIFLGGTAEVALFGPMVGGIVTNPFTAADQGIAAVEELYVSIVGAAGLQASDTTYSLDPGQSFVVPAGLASNVSVNARTAGHRFSAVALRDPVPPATPIPGPFPPSGPTTVTTTIPSYLYQEYADDDDLQAFVAAYNTMAQQYVDWFTQVGLPVYTGDAISGGLLDFVAAGLYGLPRPTLQSGRSTNTGPFNTYRFNTTTFNGHKQSGAQNFFLTNDDAYKRILTWHYYKGDGKVFNIRWLKRRIVRFLVGVNGTSPNVDATYQVSVTFSPPSQVNINIISGSSSFPLAPVLQQAIQSGALELPFQFNYVITLS